jgi:hypothetical protein
MTTKWTPGPWNIRPLTYTDGPHIPGTWTIQGRFGNVATQVFFEKDARLIAAAPEMAEALAKAIPWLGKMIADGGHLNTVAPDVCVKVLARCESLLARINGED